MDEMDEAEYMATHCVRCGELLPGEDIAALDALPPTADVAPRWVLSGSAQLRAGPFARYCPWHARRLKWCRGCGCTDEVGCAQGDTSCAWVPGVSLCSACVEHPATAEIRLERDPALVVMEISIRGQTLPPVILPPDRARALGAALVGAAAEFKRGPIV